MLKITASIRTMNLEEQRSYKLINPGLMLELDERSYFLNAGTNDVIEAFKQGVGLFVLTINNYAGYVGLDSYVISEAEPINTVFLQEYEAEEVLGKRWKDMTTRTIASRLMDYLI